MQQLNLLNLNYWAIAPEIIVSVAGVLVMLVEAFSKRGARKANGAIALISLVLAFIAVIALPRVGAQGQSYFANMIVIDPIRIFFSVTILVVAVINGSALRSRTL